MQTRSDSRLWQLLVLGIVLVVVLAACSSGSGGEKPTVVVYKSPTCGCCGNWVNHLRANGFQVQVQNVQDIMAVKTRYAVPSDLTACHTAIVDGYIVEGHVPAKDVQRLLTERPAIKGIAVPGMPAGSPGMDTPGITPQPFNVVAFDEQGNTSVFAEHAR